MTTYSLNNYSVSNALLWGNFVGHCQKAQEGSFGNRAVHIIIAGVECLPIIGQIASLFEMVIINHINYVASLEKRAEALMTKALSSPAIKALYEKANQIADDHYLDKGTWKLAFDSLFTFRGKVQGRTITLYSSLSDDKALSYFVFYLAYVTESKALDELRKKIASFIPPLEYAQEHEKISFRYKQLYYQTISQAVKEMNWDKSLIIYKSFPASFEESWEIRKDKPEVEHLIAQGEYFYFCSFIFYPITYFLNKK